jgi:hypothetical protein
MVFTSHISDLGSKGASGVHESAKSFSGSTIRATCGEESPKQQNIPPLASAASALSKFRLITGTYLRLSYKTVRHVIIRGRNSRVCTKGKHDVILKKSAPADRAHWVLKLSKWLIRAGMLAVRIQHDPEILRPEMLCRLRLNATIGDNF